MCGSRLLNFLSWHIARKPIDERMRVSYVLDYSKKRRTMGALEIVFYGRSRSSMAHLPLSDSKFLDVLKSVLTIANLFELGNGFCFTAAETEVTGADLQGSEFLLKASAATLKRIVFMTKNRLRYLFLLLLNQNKTLLVFVVSIFDDRTITISRITNKVFYLLRNELYLSSPAGPKSSFPLSSFYEAFAQYVSAIRAFFSVICSINRSLFILSRLDDFLDNRIILSESFKLKIGLLRMFVKRKRLFKWDQGNRMQQFEHVNIDHQKKCKNHMCTVLLGITSEERSSAAGSLLDAPACIPSRVRSVTSISTV